MPDIKIIKNRITRGRKYWEKENKSKFERYRNLLQTKHYPDGEEHADQISVPYVHAIIRAKLPFLYYRNPEVIVSPKRKITPESLDVTLKNIDSVRSVMEYLPIEIKIEDEIRLAVLDRVSFGRGIVKIGFEYEIENPKGIINKTINKVKDFVTRKETPTEEEVKILVDRFFVKRISYPKGFFVYDPEATRGLVDSRWCAEKMVDLLSEVKANPRFKNTSKLHSNCTVDKEHEIDKNQKDEADEERLEYYCYYEKNKYGVVNACYHVVPDQDVIMSKTANPYSHRDFPYEELDGYPVSDYLFPLGDIGPIETQQRELDLMESIQTMHARSFVQKYVYEKGKLSPSQIANLTDPNQTLVEINEESGLRALENPAINQTVPMTMDMIKGDMTKISGVSEYDTAVIPKTETTLGEAQMVQGGANNRKEDDKKSVENFVGRVMNKLFLTVQQYMTEDIVIQISGEGKSATDWLTKTPEDLQGEFDFVVQPNSASPVNKDKLRTDNLLLYDKLGKDPLVPVKGKNQLRKWILESFDKKDANLFETVLEDDPSAPATEGEIPMDMNGNIIQDAERMPKDEMGNPIIGPQEPPISTEGQQILNFEEQSKQPKQPVAGRK